MLFWVKITYLSHNISHYNYNDLFLVVGIGFYYCAICKNKYIGSSNLLPRSFVTRDVGTRLRLQIQKFFQFFHNSGTKCFNRKQPFKIFRVVYLSLFQWYVSDLPLNLHVIQLIQQAQLIRDLSTVPVTTQIFRYGIFFSVFIKIGESEETQLSIVAY